MGYERAVLGDPPQPAELERDELGYPLFAPDKLRLLELLRSHRFDELDAILTAYQAAFEEDVRYEDVLFSAFRAFSTADESLELPLGVWVAARPGAHPARLARAVYYQKCGWQSRGERWSRETTPEQFEGMRSFFSKADVDIARALELDAGLLLAYTELMNMARTRSGRDRIEELFQLGKRIAPASFQLHYAYLMALLPRWGGSYEEMARFLTESVPFMDNPRLEILKGVQAWDEGRVLRSDKEYREALRKFNESLSFGPHARVYKDRARTYFYAETYETALTDFDNALRLDPQDADSLHWRGRTLSELGRLEETVASLQTAIALDPGEPDYQEFIAGKLVYEAYELMKQQELDASTELFDKAVSLSPKRAETFYWRGRAYLERRDLEQGLVELEQAIELDPSHFESYRSIDWVLAKRGEWDEIILHWNAFLALEPEHADALFERSGTYFHKGDMERALTDAERACDLGNEEACKIRERFARQ